jgi:hypothetical protein
MEHLTGIKTVFINIAACMKSPANVRAQMVVEMASKVGKGTYNGKRAVNAVDAMVEIVGAAAVDAAGKRPRSLVSPGDLKGAFPGSALKEMVLSVATADLLHSNDVCIGAANTPRFKKIITSAKTVGPGYEPPCREQVGSTR